MMQSRTTDLMRYFNPESTASEEEGIVSISDILYKHEEDIYRLEKILKNMLYSFDKILIKIDEMSNTIESIKREVGELREKLEEQERVMFVREISFEEAKKLAEEYIKNKEDDYIDPLEIAEALQIPYEQAHEIFLALIKDGKLKLEG